MYCYHNTVSLAEMCCECHVVPVQITHRKILLFIGVPLVCLSIACLAFTMILAGTPPDEHEPWIAETATALNALLFTGITVSCVLSEIADSQVPKTHTAVLSTDDEPGEGHSIMAPVSAPRHHGEGTVCFTCNQPIEQL